MTTTNALGPPTIHFTAEIDPTARIGAGTNIWHQVQIMAGVSVGRQCVLGKGVYIATGSSLGDRVKVQNGCGIFGARLEDGAMLAPGVYLLEDPAPRAVTVDGRAKGDNDWRRVPVTIRAGATVGAGAIVAPGVTVGQYALVAIGSVVHRDAPAHALVAGNPARQVGWVCCCGERLDDSLICPSCASRYRQDRGGLSHAAPPGDNVDRPGGVCLPEINHTHDMGKDQ
jgi:UDP-2-acetamido-3-amino-2,3-dideoxy-glucuronate N-acetyltransferase